MSQLIVVRLLTYLRGDGVIASHVIKGRNLSTLLCEVTWPIKRTMLACLTSMRQEGLMSRCPRRGRGVGGRYAGSTHLRQHKPVTVCLVDCFSFIYEYFVISCQVLGLFPRQKLSLPRVHSAITRCTDLETDDVFTTVSLNMFSAFLHTYNPQV